MTLRFLSYRKVFLAPAVQHKGMAALLMDKRIGKHIMDMAPLIYTVALGGRPPFLS